MSHYAAHIFYSPLSNNCTNSFMGRIEYNLGGCVSIDNVGVCDTFSHGNYTWQRRTLCIPQTDIASLASTRNLLGYGNDQENIQFAVAKDCFTSPTNVTELAEGQDVCVRNMEGRTVSVNGTVTMYNSERVLDTNGGIIRYYYASIDCQDIIAKESSSAGVCIKGLSSNTVNPPSEPFRLSPQAVGGIIGGAIVLFLLGVYGIVYWRRMSKRKAEIAAQQQQGYALEARL